MTGRSRLAEGSEMFAHGPALEAIDGQQASIGELS